MEVREIRDLGERELVEVVANLRNDLFGKRFSNAIGELENTAGLARSRRDLARALTVARERELAAGRAGQTNDLKRRRNG
jgi:large subunit ribosomal protein L29